MSSVVGAWDKYKSVNGHTIQVLYEVGSTKVKSVFLSITYTFKLVY